MPSEIFPPRPRAHGEAQHPPSPAHLAEQQRARANAVVLRRVESLAEYQACVALQRVTWGDGFQELVSPAILMVAQKLGGVCAGAFAPDGRLLGFVFGMTGLDGGKVVHWSDLLAVHPDARGAGIGERLKRFQRELARAVGASTMKWTFDPLVARNAHLNLVRLGARVAEYVPNMYGENTGSPLHGGLATDRFVAAWDLERAEPCVHSPLAGAVLVNPVAADGHPVLNGLPDAAAVRIAIPRELDSLSADRRSRWRDVTREAFLAYLGRGYSVAGFQRAAGSDLPYYELVAGGVRPAADHPTVGAA